MTKLFIFNQAVKKCVCESLTTIHENKKLTQLTQAYPVKNWVTIYLIRICEPMVSVEFERTHSTNVQTRI